MFQCRDERVGGSYGVEVAGSCLSRVDTWSGARTESMVPPIKSKYPNHHRFSIRIDIVASIAIHAPSNQNLRICPSTIYQVYPKWNTPVKFNSCLRRTFRRHVYISYLCVLRKLTHVIPSDVIHAHAIVLICDSWQIGHVLNT